MGAPTSETASPWRRGLPSTSVVWFQKTDRARELSPHPPAAHSHRALGLLQVSRNFELVGRVNLDQLEQMKGKLESSSSEDDDKEEEVGKAEDRGESRLPSGPRWQAASRWGDGEAGGCCRSNRRSNPFVQQQN